MSCDKTPLKSFIGRFDLGPSRPTEKKNKSICRPLQSGLQTGSVSGGDGEKGLFCQFGGRIVKKRGSNGRR